MGKTTNWEINGGYGVKVEDDKNRIVKYLTDKKVRDFTKHKSMSFKIGNFFLVLKRKPSSLDRRIEKLQAKIRSLKDEKK